MTSTNWCCCPCFKKAYEAPSESNYVQPMNHTPGALDAKIAAKKKAMHVDTPQPSPKMRRTVSIDQNDKKKDEERSNG